MKGCFQPADWEQIAGHLADIHRVVADRLVPESSLVYFRRAEKEALLGIRSWLDDKIKRVEQEEQNLKGCASKASKTGNPSGNKKSSQSIPIDEM